MIAGIGTDLVEVPRIRHSIERFGNAFLNRIYSHAEQNYCMSKANFAERFAARFAAKEAGMKAIGTGWAHGVSFLDFSVENDESGRPSMVLSGKAAQIATDLAVTRVLLSMTHTATQGFAVVILESTGVHA